MTNQILPREWSASQADYPRNICIHQLFEEQLRQRPHRAAVQFGSQQLTYAELDRRSTDVAHALQASGVGPDILVGICVDRSLDMMVGLLGILKSGGAYVPLDPGYPHERLRYIVADSGLRTLVTQRSLSPSFAPEGVVTVYLDDPAQAYGQGPAASPENVDLRSSSEDLAYVIYTSGSTGKPKGVQITHRSVVNFLTSMRQTPGFATDDVLLAVTTCAFDISVLEVFLPLVAGGKVVVAPREACSDGEQLANLISESGATVMQATPTTWHLLLEADWKGQPGLTILCGGEALLPDLARQLLGKAKAVWNMYGPTESTVWSTMYQVKDLQPSMPVGRPIANTQIYVLDAALQPVSDDATGELYLGGDGLARGYHNRPQLTAERFIANPFEITQSSRIYRTGDLVRWSSSGQLEYVGRADQQVKLRGYRIELGEIEAALAEHPDIVRAAVVMHGEALTRKLIAYVMARDTREPTPAELRTFLKDHLPFYMVPARFVVMQQLPLTQNGKIDRSALPGETLRAEPTIGISRMSL
jgi:amino acid adenylation domain-containing protein